MQHKVHRKGPITEQSEKASTDTEKRHLLSNYFKMQFYENFKKLHEKKICGRIHLLNLQSILND